MILDSNKQIATVPTVPTEEFIGVPRQGFLETALTRVSKPPCIRHPTPTRPASPLSLCAEVIPHPPQEASMLGS